MGVHGIEHHRDLGHDAFEIAENVVVPEANDFEALGAKIKIAVAIFLLMPIEIVLTTVDFDNQAR